MPNENQTSENSEILPASGSGLTALLRRVMLASVGAAALTIEEAEGFVSKLVDKGAIVEKDGMQLIQEWRQQRQAAAKKKDDETREIQAILPTEASRAKIISQNIVSISLFSNGPAFRLSRRHEVESEQEETPDVKSEEA